MCTPSNTCFQGPPESTRRTASRSVQPFLHSSLQRVAIVYNGTPLYPLTQVNIASLNERSEPPSSTWFLGATRVHSPHGISISSAVFQGLRSWQTRQTDRQTDHATRSVTLYVRSTAMRPNRLIIVIFKVNETELYQNTRNVSILSSCISIGKCTYYTSKCIHNAVRLFYLLVEYIQLCVVKMWTYM